MVDLGALGTLLGALKGAKDIAQTMIGLRDAAAFQGKMIEFQGKILEAQDAAFSAQQERATLVQRVGDLEKEMTDLKAHEAKLDRYELKDLGYGSLAYMLKRESRSTEPPHWACTNCYGNGKISPIQHIQLIGHGYRYMCPACKTTINPAPESMHGSSAKWLD